MMKKWVAVLLMLVLALSLTGCQTDPAKEAAKVVAEVNGAKITKGEAESIYNQMMTETEYYYSMYGYSFDRTDKTVIASIKSQTLTLMTENLALEQKAEALGLGGKAAAARNGKHGVGLGPGRAQHPREVLVFEQVRHAEIVLAGLELRVPGKNALVGRNALHLLPGVVDNVHF